MTEDELDAMCEALIRSGEQLGEALLCGPDATPEMALTVLGGAVNVVVARLPKRRQRPVLRQWLVAFEEFAK